MLGKRRFNAYNEPRCSLLTLLMNTPEINQNRQGRRRLSIRWRYFLYVGLILLILAGALTIGAIRSGDESLWSNLINATERYIPSSFSSTFGTLTEDPTERLTGIDQDRVNILLLGIGGKGHEGANLTDTIIVASYKPSTKEVSMLSIPRDLIVPIPGYGWRKINNLYSLAEYNDPGTGGDYTKQVISQIFGLQIPYYARIDFQGFVELIDLIGGVDVEVPRTLSDRQYPVPGREDYPEDQRYEHLLVEAGLQHLDGNTALKYVRSRHASGEEGSDFARAARQQLVMKAVLDKLLSFNTLLRPTKIKKIYNNVESHVDTNLSLDHMAAFASLVREYFSEKKEPLNVVLSDALGGPLQAANYNGAFVLEPKVSDFSELKFIAEHMFEPNLTFIRPSEEESALPKVTIEKPVPSKDKATIEIQNGTFVNGLARAMQAKLVELEYEIPAVGNATTQDYTTTIIYDLSDGKYPTTLDFLAANFTDNITSQIPLGVSSTADFLMILGLDLAYQ